MMTGKKYIYKELIETTWRNVYQKWINDYSYFAVSLSDADLDLKLMEFLLYHYDGVLNKSLGCLYKDN